MTLATIQSYIYLRTKTNSTSFTNANMLIYLNVAYENVANQIRTWYDNFRPTNWTSSDLSTGTATPFFDSNFHELIGLEVSYKYAIDNNLPNQTGLFGELLKKWEDLKDFYGNRKYRMFTVTIASPGVFTLPNHGLKTDDQVSFVTSGALPTGLSADTKYYILSVGLDDDNFRVSATRESDGGTAINTTGTQSGTHWVWAEKHGRFIDGAQTRGDSNK